MARIKLARYLFAMAILTMPLSYALKSLSGLVGITWIDPTLVLGFAVFLLLGVPLKGKASFRLVAFAFLSAFIGLYLMGPSPDRDRSAVYVAFVEPVRLTLNVIWFWISIRFFRMDSKFVLRWLSISVIWEFCVACYLYAALYSLAPVPEPVQLYLDIYKTRQVVFWGGLPVYRMAGTFIESPPFGLFMFCCFVILALRLYARSTGDDQRLRVWMKTGAVLSFLGALASFSNEILIALLVFGLVFALVSIGRTKSVAVFLWFGLAMSLAAYVVWAESTRWKNDTAYSGDPMGTSVSERFFHVSYGLGLFIEKPLSILTGIGPGRYGDYAVRTGYFPSTVTPQFTPLEWIVEYGLIGTFLIGSWLARVRSNAVLAYGTIGAGVLVALLIANAFQANWLWEAWFLALAFLRTGYFASRGMRHHALA